MGIVPQRFYEPIINGFHGWPLAVFLHEVSFTPIRGPFPTHRTLCQQFVESKSRSNPLSWTPNGWRLDESAVFGVWLFWKISSKALCTGKTFNYVLKCFNMSTRRESLFFVCAVLCAVTSQICYFSKFSLHRPSIDFSPSHFFSSSFCSSPSCCFAFFSASTVNHTWRQIFFNTFLHS